jgi:hypothetical protein
MNVLFIQAPYPWARENRMCRQRVLQHVLPTGKPKPPYAFPAAPVDRQQRLYHASVSWKPLQFIATAAAAAAIENCLPASAESGCLLWVRATSAAVMPAHPSCTASCGFNPHRPGGGQLHEFSTTSPPCCDPSWQQATGGNAGVHDSHAGPDCHMAYLYSSARLASSGICCLH